MSRPVVRGNTSGIRDHGSGSAQESAQIQVKPNPKSLKRGRLSDIRVLMESLRFHRPAIAAVLGEQESRRLATFAGKIIEILDRHPTSLDRRLAVDDGVVTGSMPLLSMGGRGSLEVEGSGPERPLVARVVEPNTSPDSSRVKAPDLRESALDGLAAGDLSPPPPTTRTEVDS